MLKEIFRCLCSIITSFLVVLYVVWIGYVIRDESFKKEAIKAGYGEYYIKNSEKEFRWIECPQKASPNVPN